VIKNKQKLFRFIGVLGVILCLAAFIRTPSFPTPDKLLVFLFFIFMSFNQGWALLKRLLPFVSVLLLYESFRGVADKLNTHVNYLLAPHFDNYIFGRLPTQILQGWWWKGRTSWYDYVFYLAYMAHFILPICLAVVVWKTRTRMYWRVISTYLVVAFAAFLTFFLLPSAPPWLASDNHYIAHITRISSYVWAGLGLKNFPSFYNHISANPVAAIPSLHAAWATLLVIFVYRLYGLKWAALAAIYPFLIYVGTIYEGEHYAFDVISGMAYAAAGYLVTPWIMSKVSKLWGYARKHIVITKLQRV
jgi:membrane-associated phospholipid phosphatase